MQKLCFTFYIKFGFRAGHYKDLTETGNRARKVSGTQGNKLYNKQVNGKHIYSVYTIRVYVRFPFSPKFRKFRLEIKWNGSFWSGPTGIFGTTFDRSAHFRQIGLKGPFPFDKIIVPSATFLHPSYKNNNQTRGGLGPVCATGMYRSMDSIGHGISNLSRQAGIFVEWKAPHA